MLFPLRNLQIPGNKGDFALFAEFPAPGFFLESGIASQSMLEMHGGEGLSELLQCKQQGTTVRSAAEADLHWVITQTVLLQETGDDLLKIN